MSIFEALLIEIDGRGDTGVAVVVENVSEVVGLLVLLDLRQDGVEAMFGSRNDGDERVATWSGG